MISRARRLWERAVQRPVLVVAIVALVARLVFVVVSGFMVQGVLIPDELQYIELADYVASGRGAEAWFPGYGQALYDRTIVFMAPLTAMFELFGRARFLGQLLAMAGGVVAAALTAAVARRYATDTHALVAGVIVALLPSQVLWSSVVLRESLVWAALVAVAWGVVVALHRRDVPTLTRAIGVMALSLLALGFLRGHTLLIAAWALIVAALVAKSARPWATRIALVAVAVVLPAVAGQGLAGWSFVQQNVPQLAATRSGLAANAETEFVDDHVVAIDDSPDSPETDVAKTQRTLLAAGYDPNDVVLAVERARQELESEEDAEGEARSRERLERLLVIALADLEDKSTEGYAAVHTGTGFRVYDQSLGGTLAQLPRSLLGLMARPYPWEATSSIDVRLAGLENMVWYALYALSAVGLWSERRRLRAVAFPVVFIAGLVFANALVQGNVGTAFRHRGQIAWAVAIMATFGLVSLSHCALRRAPRAAHRDESDPTRRRRSRHGQDGRLTPERSQGLGNEYRTKDHRRVSQAHEPPVSPLSAEHGTGTDSTDVRPQGQAGRLRVLYVVQSSERDRHLNAIVDHTSLNDVEFLVASLGRGGPLQSDMESRSIEVILLGGHRWGGLLPISLRIRQLMIDRRVDLVHTHLVQPTLAVELARMSAFRPPPVIQSRHHNLAHHRIRRKLHVRVDTWLAKRADRVIAVSEAVRHTLTELEGVPRERVEVVYNGIDAALLEPVQSNVERWRSIFGSGPAAVAVGRLHPEKDYPNLVRAFAIARIAQPDLSLFIAGRGSDAVQDEIALISGELMVSEAVHLVGWVDDVFAFIQAADVFVQASVDEAFSQTVMEAICLGVPVAVTTPGGVAEVVDGWYPNVESGNPEALAARIREVLAAGSSATSRLEKAKADTRNRFSAEKLAASHVAAYRETIRTSQLPDRQRLLP